jgi:hypothetical protein
MPPGAWWRCALLLLLARLWGQPALAREPVPLFGPAPLEATPTTYRAAAHDAAEFAELIRQADRMMYEYKSRHRSPPADEDEATGEPDLGDESRAEKRGVGEE